MDCLIVKNDGLGDLVLSSGLISSFSNCYKGNIDLITCIENKEVAEKINGINNIFYISRDSLDILEENQKTISYGFDSITLNTLEQKTYDHAIILRRFIRRSTLALMQKIQARKKFCCWQFQTNINFEFAKHLSKGWEHFNGNDQIINEALYLKSFLDQTFGYDLEYHPKLETPPHSTPSILSKRKKLVALGVSGRGFEKEKWFHLVNMLIEKDYTPVLFGGSEVSHECGQIEAFFPKTINLIGRTSISSFLNELKNFEFYIGNDTGTAHLASLIVPKCLIIYGGGTFGRFFPWPKVKNQFILYKSLGCFDCDWKCKYKDNLCLTEITPHDVISYFEEITKNTATPLKDINTIQSDYNLHWQYCNINNSQTTNTAKTLLFSAKSELISSKTSTENSTFLEPQITPTSNKPKDKPKAYIFGSSAYGKLAQTTLSDKYDFIGFIDNDQQKQDKVINGLKIHSPEILTNLDPQTIILIASQYQTQITHQLIELGINFSSIKNIPYKQIATLYCLQQSY